MMLKQLAEGVYLGTDTTGNNVGVVDSGHGAVLIDAPLLPDDARALQEDLQRIDAPDIYAIVNTDYHPEHFLGNGYFAPVRVIGNEAAFKPISKYESSLLEQLSSSHRDADPHLAEQLGEIKVQAPELSVEDRLTLYLRGRQVQVLHLEGHTPASLGVWIPEAKILFAGDNIVNNEHPVMSQANSEAWVHTLERIREMDVELLIPGSGEPGGKDLIEPLYTYVREMRQRVSELYEAGASRRETVDKVGMLEFFPVPEDQVAQVKRRRRENVERVYAEIRTSHPRRR